MFKINLKLKTLKNCTIHLEIIWKDCKAGNLAHKTQGKNNAQETNTLPQKICLLKEYEVYEVASNLCFCIFQECGSIIFIDCAVYV